MQDLAGDKRRVLQVQHGVDDIADALRGAGDDDNW
jgi:hypothetical protein